MKEKRNRFCKCINRHVLTCAVIFILIIVGPILIAIDLTYLKDWISGFNVGDFYTYLTFMGVISLWSVYGLAVTIMKSVGGITVYMIGLVVVTIIHFIIGFIHIMLLFVSYQPILMDTCLQRQPHRFFWWSMGYEDSEEMKQIYLACSKQWYNFATERIVSWVLYTALSFISLYAVMKYQQYMVRQRNRVQGAMADNNDEWSDEEGYNNLMEKKHHSAPQVMTYHDEEFPSTEDSELSVTMYQQRQKLFDEIAKRKRARKNLNRKSLMANSDRNSVIVVHPLDLAQDPEVYRPPPMPPADGSESWNRYDDSASKEDQEALDRQKRVDALSTERLEYEMYRNEPSSNASSVHELSEAVQRDTSRRKRPKSARWSVSYSDTSSSSHTLRRLSSTHEGDEEEHQQHGSPLQDGEYQQHDSPLQEEAYQHDGSLQEEDNYDDVPHEDLLSEDEEESSASNSLLKPANEEKI